MTDVLRESKLGGVTKRVFVTPWEMRKSFFDYSAAAGPSNFKLDIPKPPRLFFLSIGAFTFNGFNAGAAANSAVYRIFAADTIPAVSTGASTNIPLEVWRDVQITAIGSSFRNVIHSFYPDGLLFPRSFGGALLANYGDPVDMIAHTMLVWYRFENWS